MIRVLDARFLTTAVAPDGYPPADRPEVAFVGRSNVGKSSMINALTGRRKLVRVSNTPGRTRTLNFFDVELTRDGQRCEIRLADLPGYGFAKASRTERKSWEGMITTYLRKRPSLKVVVSLIDAEVGSTPDDLRTLDYLNEAAGRILVVATKVDRIVKAKRKPRMKALAAEVGLPEEAVQAFSATEKIGIDETWGLLLDTLAERSDGQGEA